MVEFNDFEGQEDDGIDLTGVLDDAIAVDDIASDDDSGIAEIELPEMQVDPASLVPFPADLEIGDDEESDEFDPEAQAEQLRDFVIKEALPSIKDQVDKYIKEHEDRSVAARKLVEDTVRRINEVSAETIRQRHAEQVENLQQRILVLRERYQAYGRELSDRASNQIQQFSSMLDKYDAARAKLDDPSTVSSSGANAVKAVAGQEYVRKALEEMGVDPTQLDDDYVSAALDPGTKDLLNGTLETPVLDKTEPVASEIQVDDQQDQMVVELDELPDFPEEEAAKDEEDELASVVDELPEDESVSVVDELPEIPEPVAAPEPAPEPPKPQKVAEELVVDLDDGIDVTPDLPTYPDEDVKIVEDPFEELGAGQVEKVSDEGIEVTDEPEEPVAQPQFEPEFEDEEEEMPDLPEYPRDAELPDSGDPEDDDPWQTGQFRRNRGQEHKMPEDILIDDKKRPGYRLRRSRLRYSGSPNLVSFLESRGHYLKQYEAVDPANKQKAQRPIIGSINVDKDEEDQIQYQAGPRAQPIDPLNVTQEMLKAWGVWNPDEEIVVDKEPMPQEAFEPEGEREYADYSPQGAGYTSDDADFTHASEEVDEGASLGAYDFDDAGTPAAVPMHGASQEYAPWAQDHQAVTDELLTPSTFYEPGPLSSENEEGGYG